MTKEEIIAVEDGVSRVLEGAELEAFLEDRRLALESEKAQKAEAKAKDAAKTSVLAKLTALGLTEDEVNGLIS